MSSATHVVQTDFYFHPTQIVGNQDPVKDRAPGISVLWLGYESGDLFKIDRLASEGSAVHGDPLEIITRLIDATLCSVPLLTDVEINNYSVRNGIARELLEKEIVIQRSPFQGMRLSELLKGVSDPVRIAAGVSIGAVGFVGAGETVAVAAGGAGAIGAAVAGGVAIVLVAGGILLIGSSIVAVEWLRRRFTP